MWIRNQSKEKLMNVNTIFISDYRTYCDVSCYQEQTSVVLGKYSTKEKALKVLDMIQRNIDLIENTKVLSSMVVRDSQILIGRNFFIFQMPLDSEVEE